jgi:hypothetical protein
VHRRQRVEKWLLAACALGLACHPASSRTRGELVTKVDDASASTPLVELEPYCGDRPLRLIVNERGGCIEDCDGTRWCWGADLRATRAKPDDADEFESVYLTCLRGLESWSRCRDPELPKAFVVEDELDHVDHVCTLNADAEVVCAGDNRYAQLGLGHTHRHSSGNDNVDLPITARAVGVAQHHSCAALEDRVMCWGMPTWGMPNTDDASHRFDFEAVDIRVDDSLSCARKVDGTIWCWGSPDEEEEAIEDQFGGVEAGARPRQVSVPWRTDAVGPSWVLSKQVLRHVRLDGNLAAGADDVVWQTSRVREAESGFNVMCVHWTSGRLRCVYAFAPDALEELAVVNAREPDGASEDFYPELDHVSDFSIDLDGVCVVRHGKVQCATSIGGWTEVEGIDAAVRVANRCAVEASGTVTCWSLEDANGYAIKEVHTTRAHDAVDIAVNLVLTERGSLERIDDAGELEVLIERGVVQFDADGFHACARIDDDGDGRSESIECFGENDVGQLGKPSDALILAPKVVVFESALQP